MGRGGYSRAAVEPFKARTTGADFGGGQSARRNFSVEFCELAKATVEITVEIFMLPKSTVEFTVEIFMLPKATVEFTVEKVKMQIHTVKRSVVNG